jgi:predicted Na+-dependent transporter
MRKKTVQMKPIVGEEKPSKESSNKLVDVLLGILLFPILIWAAMGSSNIQVSKGKTVLIIVFFLLIAIGLSMIGNK